MVKGIVIGLLLIIGIFLLIDYQVVNLSQIENIVSKALDWSIDKYLKAKDVFFNETP